MTTLREVPAPAVVPTADSARTLVDCDVHVYFKDGLNDVAEYIPIAWRERLGIGRASIANGVTVGLPKNEFYINTTGGIRRDALADTGPPASDPDAVARQLLDDYGIFRAILLGGPNSGLGTLPDPDAAAVYASAYNDWLCDHWLAADPRFRGALLVAPQDPRLAVAEIERVCARPGIAAIHMPVSRPLAGERHFYPIYEAAERQGLPIMLHPGATESIYANAPMLGGVPTYYIEWHTLLTIPMQANMVSLLCHGVFERFPGLRYVFVRGDSRGPATSCGALIGTGRRCVTRCPGSRRHRVTTWPITFGSPPNRCMSPAGANSWHRCSKPFRPSARCCSALTIRIGISTILAVRCVN